MLNALPKWRSKSEPAANADASSHLELARESLRDLVNDDRLPAGVREALASDYASVQGMLDKLEHGHLHIAVFGRVSTGKSSLLNALIGEQRFATSPLHGETRVSNMQAWQEVEAGGVYLIDTPGLDEAGGESREALAKEVAGRADLVIFVVDSDLTDSELAALRTLLTFGRPVLLALNKADLFTAAERQRLLEILRTRTEALLNPQHIIAVAADPRPQTLVEVDANGTETLRERAVPPDVDTLRVRLWEIIDAEGKTLAALNASLFASDLSDQVGQRILLARQELGEKLTRTYCVGKGIAVAFNPLPVADLFAAAAIDAGMVLHLSKLYGLPLSRQEAGKLTRVIATHAAALMGTVWAIHLIASALKAGSGGLSTIVTASAQGAVAYYSTYVVGKVAGQYLAQGKSWGAGGPKQVVRQIIDSLDRETVLNDARREIKARLKFD